LIGTKESGRTHDAVYFALIASGGMARTDERLCSIPPSLWI
jgi:hypothetical protein